MLKKNKGCWKLLDICSVCVKTVVNIHYSLQSDSFCKQLCEIIICTTCTIVVHYNAWLFFFSQVKKIKEFFFVRILKLFISTWRLFDFLHLHYVYIIYVCVEVQRGMSNGRLFFTIVSLAIPFTQVAKYCAINMYIY